MNARTREEIGYVTCSECGGDGADLEDSTKDCWKCDGHGDILAETPRLAVQRHEGGRWRTLLMVDGDKHEEAVKWQLQYLGEQPGNYRIVQEVDAVSP